MGLSSAAQLLSGPRGRELCLELARLAAPSGPGETYGSRALPAPGMSREGERILRTLAGLPERPVFTGPQLYRTLAATVRQAVYWRAPDETDALLAEPELRQALAPVAAAVVRSPAAAWWSAPAAPVTHCVQWIQTSTVPGTAPPALQGSRTALEQWRQSTAAQEATTAFSAGWAARWWSSPSLSGLVSSTPAVPGMGPAGLELVEDALAWTQARSYPLRPAQGARIREIRGPEDWQDLAARYPLDVTRSRGSCWNQAVPDPAVPRTWVIPDFSAVAEDYDAVHLTVSGYLSTAGAVLAARPAIDFSGVPGTNRTDATAPAHGSPAAALTMMAGWGPGETWWLNDVLEPAGDPVGWETVQGGAGHGGTGHGGAGNGGAGHGGSGWRVSEGSSAGTW